MMYNLWTFTRPDGIIHYPSYMKKCCRDVACHVKKNVYIIISMSALPSGLFPFADAKIEPFFQTPILSHEGKIPKWNERNEKAIFTGTNGMFLFSTPSPIRSTG